ncbi:DEAD/DEAH box helicase [Coprinopsis cinerea AmutBmut pab1-1]|nr:DEAD/DEAH box helicase [Coprinopsis cinerea AmutBmut pab1-1]
MDLDGFDGDIPRRNRAFQQHSDKIQDALDALDVNWYIPKTRGARFMDLLGDYAGNELFVIDGESLFQTILDDPLLAIGRPGDTSFQILHAYYLLEKRLREFTQRSANFEIVFFHKYRHLTLRTGDDDFVVASRTLARTLLYRHLTKLELTIHVFEDLDDPQWKTYEHIHKPMFILMNDGGVSDSGRYCVHRVLAQREFVLRVLDGQMAMALMKGIVFSDSKISTFIYEPMRNPALRGKSPIGFAAFKRVQKILEKSFENQSNNCRHRLVAHPPTSSSSSRDFLVALSKGLLEVSQSPNLLYLFLIHWFTLPQLSVVDRARPPVVVDGNSGQVVSNLFLSHLFFLSCDLLSSSFPAVEYDFDGVAFMATVHFMLACSSDIREVMGVQVYDRVAEIWHELPSQRLDLQKLKSSISFAPGKSARSGPVQPLQLLPFDNPLLNKYLPRLSLKVADDSPRQFLEFGKGTLFSDTQHWHSQRSLLPSHLGGSAPKALTAWAYRRQLRSNQIFMYNMQLQAATITGASGTALQQQVIPPVGKSGSKTKATTRDKPATLSTNKSSKKSQISSKQALLQQIQREKTDQMVEASRVWWKEKLTSFSKLSLAAKSSELAALFRNKRSDEPMLGLEMRLYKLHLEIQLWSQEPDPSKPEVHDRHSVSILRIIKDICQRKTLTAAWKDVLISLMTVMGFQQYISSLLDPIPIIKDVKPTFKFVKIVSSKTGTPTFDFLSIKENPVKWQLRLFGEFMDRSMDSAPDRRVPFEPDAWQRKVLDCIDQNHSILVVAPTSAGKTFISFYAMEQVLRASDEGVLVYVAPTKALVTQITAEIYARFSKQLTGRSCWAIHTRDYRIHDPQKCQILVTVPEVLAILLLSPAMARSWVPKIKRIILDEIHSIGQQEGGAVWEQILLMAPCPIIGLSATIGSPETFNNWLASVQKAHGFHHTFIHHPHRYSHLRKFFYVIDKEPEKRFVSLDDYQPTSRLKFLHPIGTLSFGKNTIPDDLALEARDTLTLYEALSSIVLDLSDDALIAEIRSLDPKRFFKSKNHFLRQKDVLEYEARLKAVLTELTKDMDYDGLNNPLLTVVERVQDKDLLAIGQEKLNAHPDRDAFESNLLHMLADLHVRGDLPAILFNFDRSQCEVIAQEICSGLEKAEEEWKAKSPRWKQKVAQWEAWKLAAKEREKVTDKMNKQKKRGGRNEDDDPSLEQEANISWEQSFDPNAPLQPFSFVNTRSGYTVAELEEEIRKQTRRFGVSKMAWIYVCLRRGIAVHHAGMPKSYRSLVESLFRRGFIRVVVATGTLALGINAPAKTAIFCNDSPYLTALMYRQCAGRAGRRGYDLLGNVIFYGIPMDRVQRLILSRLPSLGGGFPVTSTLVLRLCNLLEESKHAENVVKAIETLMSLPRVSFASDVGRDHLMHHIRFSIEYLRRSGLLNESGQAMNLFAIAGHLYYTEPSNLGLVSLMRSGVLHEICNDSDIESAKRTYILVMCHLFGRRYLRKVELDKGELEYRRKRYPSSIVLPPMPEVAQQKLKAHSHEILKIFSGYAMAFAKEREDELEESRMRLPLSGIEVVGQREGGELSPLVSHLRSSSIPVTTRSAFVATSGHDDTFKSVQELADTVREGIHLNAHAIPCIDHIVANNLDPEHQLNAYLLDFYTHGQDETLVKANGIRRGDIWYLLEDFRLTLSTVRSALQQLLTKASNEQLGTLGSENDELEDDSGYGGSTVDIGDAEDDDEGGFDEFETGVGSSLGGGGEDDWNADGEFKRPRKVTDADWRVYKIVSLAYAEFDAKAKAMWA